MAKNVFRADEILYQSRKVFIKPPKVEPEESLEEVESLEEYEELLAQLPKRGLCFRMGFEPAVYGALPPNFPGSEVWLLG